MTVAACGRAVPRACRPSLFAGCGGSPAPTARLLPAAAAHDPRRVRRHLVRRRGSPTTCCPASPGSPPATPSRCVLGVGARRPHRLAPAAAGDCSSRCWSSCGRSRRRCWCRSSSCSPASATLMKILVIVSGCVWPILLNTVEGVRGRRRGAGRHLPRLPASAAGAAAHLVLRAASPQIVDRRPAGAVDRHHPDGDQRDVRRQRRPRLHRSCSSSAASRSRRCGAACCCSACIGVVLPLLFRLVERRVLAGTTACARPSAARMRRDLLEVAACARSTTGTAAGSRRSRDLTFTSTPASSSAWSGRPAAARPRCCGASPGCCAPTAGEVLVDGQPVDRAAGRAWPWCSRSTAAACSRGCACARTSSCRCRHKKLPGAERRPAGRRGARRGRAWPTPRDAYPWQLSGGMQQRVAIARAIAYRAARCC